MVRKRTLFFVISKRTVIWLLCAATAVSGLFFIHKGQVRSVGIISLEAELNDAEPTTDGDKRFIKWMEYKVPLAVMEQALKYDVESCGRLHWVELIAYTAAKNYGAFGKKKSISDHARPAIPNQKRNENIVTTATALIACAFCPGFKIDIISAVSPNSIGNNTLNTTHIPSIDDM